MARNMVADIRRATRRKFSATEKIRLTIRSLQFNHAAPGFNPKEYDRQLARMKIFTDTEAVG